MLKKQKFKFIGYEWMCKRTQAMLSNGEWLYIDVNMQPISEKRYSWACEYTPEGMTVVVMRKKDNNDVSSFGKYWVIDEQEKIVFGPYDEAVVNNDRVEILLKGNRGCILYKDGKPYEEWYYKKKT